ncbi:hypothetical protein ACXYL9_03665 [Qipengyuania sp. CAU 1752]
MSEESIESPPTVDNNANAWNRQGALEEIENLKVMRATSWEQHSHSFKWLTASLLALNAGGLLAMSQVQAIGVDDKLIAGGCFAVGLSFALLVAVIGQRSITATLLPLQRHIGYWMSVSRDGERNEGFEKELAKEFEKPTILGKIGQVMGWGSALSFFVAIYFAGVGLMNFEIEAMNSADLEVERR